MATTTRKAVLTLAALACGLATWAQTPRVFVNPGHGGYDNDDRPITFTSKGSGKKVTYYESVSNQRKGTDLYQILRRKGYEVYTSRNSNTSNDDLDLFEIVALAQNSGADAFVAVHSNATGTQRRTNVPLGLYRGFTGRPANDGSLQLAQLVMQQIYNNAATCWSGKLMMRGDWSFYPHWGYKVGLGVMRYNKMPGLLSEGSFHDYLPERCRLMNAGYCWLEAWNISVGVDQYFGKTKRYRAGVVAGVVRNGEKSVWTGETPLFGNDEKRAVNGATVTLTDAKGRQVGKCVTDDMDNGVFVFRNVAAGRYTVTVHKGAAVARNVSSTVTVKADATSYCNLTVN